MVRVSWLLVSLLIVVTIVVIFVVAARGTRARVTEGGLVSAFRLITSAPAFFVPAAMVVVGVTLLGFAVRTHGENPWASTSPDQLVVSVVTLVAVSAGIAGHIGLLEAYRSDRTVGSDAFLDGIRAHTITIAIAKLSLGAAVAVLGRVVHRVVLDPFVPYGFGWQWLLFLVPCFLVAPVVGTATLHPRRPIRALGAAISTALARPWAVAKVFLVQFAITAVGISLIAEYVYRDESLVFAVTCMHASTLSFNLFPFVVFSHSSDGLGLMIPIVVVSPVLLTAYWMTAAPARRTDRAAVA